MLKRILVIVIILILMIGVLLPTAAIELSTGEILKSYGFITGDANGDLNEEAYVTRAEMMVIMSRLTGEFEQASTYTGTSTFIDGEGHWAEPFVAYGEVREWTSGIGRQQFGYNQRHTSRETAVLMLKILGYLPGADFSWETAFDMAKRLNLMPDHLTSDQFLQRKDLFEIIHRSLKTPMNRSTFPLIHFLPVSKDALSVISVRRAGNNKVEVVFSEPIKTFGKIKMFDQSQPFEIMSINYSGDDRIVAELNREIKDETEYSVQVSEFISRDGDFCVPRYTFISSNSVVNRMSALFPGIQSSSTEEVVARPRMIAGILSATQTHFTLEFSNAVTGLTPDHLKYNNGDSPLGLYLDQEMTQPVNPQDPVSKVYAKLAEKTDSGITGKPLQAGTSEIRIEGTTASGAQLTNGWGSVVEKMILPVTVEGDGTPPAVTRLERITGSSNTLRVEFSEPVTLAANQVEVRYSTGALIPGLWVSVSGSGSAYTLQLNDANLSGRSLRVTLRNVSDLAFLPNTLAAHSATVSFPDVERPFVTDALMDSVSKQFYVTFNKPVDLSSATSRSRYAISYGGSALVLSRTPVQVGTSGSGARTFRLSLTSTEYTLAQSTGAQLTVSGVQDLSGNAMSTQSYNVSTMTDVSKNPPQLVSVYATDSRSVTAVFNQPLTRVDSGAFKVNLANVSSMTFAVSGGQTLVRLQTASALPSNLASVSLLVDTTGVSKVQNLYGIDVRNTTRVLEDRR